MSRLLGTKDSEEYYRHILDERKGIFRSRTTCIYAIVINVLLSISLLVYLLIFGVDYNEIDFDYVIALAAVYSMNICLSVCRLLIS